MVSKTQKIQDGYSSITPGRIIVFDGEFKVDFVQVGKSQRADGTRTWILSFNWCDYKPGMRQEDIKVQGLSIHETKAFKKKFNDDSEVCKYIYDVMTASDVIGWVGFNSDKFDIPLINTRLQANGLPTLPQMPSDDIHKIFKSAKGRMSLVSYSLDYLCEFYGLPMKEKVGDEVWVLARAGHVPSLKKVSKYGMNDVAITALLYDKARLLNGSKFSPNNVVNPKDPVCPHCGSKSLHQPSGTVYNKTFKYKYYSCKTCGKNSRGIALAL